jgi:hypothetical protein
MPPVLPPGYAPFPSRRPDVNPYGGLIDFLRQNRQADYAHAMAMVPQAGHGWRTAGNIAGSIYPAYLELQTQKREQADRERARALEHQANLATRGEAQLRALQEGTTSEAALDKILGPRVPPVTPGLDGGPPQGGIEGLPPSPMTFRPDSFERIIPPVRVDDAGVVSGGIQDLAQGGFPIRPEPPARIVSVPQPGLTPSGQPYPDVEHPIRSQDEMTQAALDASAVVRQQTIDEEQRAEQREISADQRGLIDAIAVIDHEAEIQEETDERRHGLTLEEMAARQKYDLENLEFQAVQAGIRNNDTIAGANFRAQLGNWKEIHVPHPTNTDLGSVVALISREEDGKPVIIYPLTNGEPTLSPKEDDTSAWEFDVDSATGERVAIRIKNGTLQKVDVPGVISDQQFMNRLKESSETDAFEWIQGLYREQNQYRVPRHPKENPSLQQVIDGEVDWFVGASIAGWGAKPMTAWNEMMDVNQEASKLTQDLQAASQNFYTVAMNYGNYRRSITALKILEDKLGTLEGGFFTGRQSLQARADSWMELVDDIVRTSARDVSMENTTAGQKERSDFSNLLGAAQRLEHVLGLTNRPPIIGEYFTDTEQAEMTPNPLLNRDLRGRAVSDEELDQATAAGAR